MVSYPYQCSTTAVFKTWRKQYALFWLQNSELIHSENLPQKDFGQKYLPVVIADHTQSTLLLLTVVCDIGLGLQHTYNIPVSHWSFPDISLKVSHNEENNYGLLICNLGIFSLNANISMFYVHIMECVL